MLTQDTLIKAKYLFLYIHANIPVVYTDMSGMYVCMLQPPWELANFI